MAAPSSGTQLPSKEANVFRQLVRFYETKQYKKGLKAADQILKKVPEHGETLAMQGLILNSLDRKEEAYDLVRRGLKADLKSHVCWHVYGLLYRSDNNYPEAVKCYRNALRQDKDNLQILRDLAQLQVQMRDAQGFLDTRQQLLQLKPTNRNHWISLAVAHHLAKNHELAVKIIESYEGTQTEIPASEAYEHSEIMLYKASVLAEAGKYEEALAVLELNKPRIRDQLGMQQMQAAIYLKLGRLQEAQKAYRALVAILPDDYNMHAGLHRAMGLPAAEEGEGPANGGSAAATAAPLPLDAARRAQLDATYAELQAAHPRSAACRRIPLDFASGEEFRSLADTYVRRYLTSGIPSLFADLKPLYRDAAKAATLQQLFHGYLDALTSTGALPPLAAPPGGGAAAAASGGKERAEAGEKKEPQTLSWVLLYLAQHYDLMGDSEAALRYVDGAARHTPTIIECYSIKARLLKHMGCPEGAALMADRARMMDLSDRYLNSMAAKALLTADSIELAERTAALFTKDSDTLSALADMQHMWLEVARGWAYQRRGQLGPALKNFLAVDKSFADIQEDQFDFHSYCIRKMTLRSYMDMLAMEDAVYSHPFYSQAACSAVECYLHLFDHPNGGAQAEAEEEARVAAMGAEERKKYKLAKKKEEKRREAEEKARAEAEAAAKAAAAKEAAREAAAAAKEGGQGEEEDKRKKKGGKEEKKKEDPDPEGKKLVAVADPLGEAAKFVAVLKQHAPFRLGTQVATFEVYLRRGRLLLAVAAVSAARDIAGAAAPQVHRMVVRCCRAAQQAPPGDGRVAQLVEEGVRGLLGSSGDSVTQYNEQYIQQHASTSPLHAAAAAEMLVLLEPAQRSRAVQVVLQHAAASTSGSGRGAVVPGGAAGGGGGGGAQAQAGRLKHADYVAVHKLLLGGALQDEAAAAQWKAHCAALFPWSTYFGGAKARAVLADAEIEDVAAALQSLTIKGIKH